MTEQYLSVADFAKLAGVTRQAVYSRLDSQELSSFVKLDTTRKPPKKLVNINAISCFEAGVRSQRNSQIDCKETSKDVKQIELLQAQLTAKDKHIEALLHQLEEVQKQNELMSKSLIEQSKELTKLLDQQQQLQAQQILSTRVSTTLPESIPPEDVAAKTTPPEEPSKKRGLLSWLFN